MLAMLIMLTTLLLGISVYAEPIGNLESSDLVAQWKFDETSGSTVYDSLGNYNGTANGTTIITGVEGKARRFNGTSDTVTFTNTIIPTGNKTIKFSIRRSTVPENFEWVFTTGISQVAGEANCTAYIRSSSDASPGTLYFYICDKSGGTASSVAYVKTQNICDNNWHNVVAVFDNDLKKATVYVDDLNTPVESVNYIVEKSDNTAYSRNLKMGASYTSSGNDGSYFTGDLDEFEIYNKCYIPAPQNLTAAAGDAQVTLNWDAVDGATGYNVKRATSSGGPYETVTSAVYNTYTDTTVTNGVTYYYVVTAVNSSGESLNSAEVSATPQAANLGKIMLKTEDGMIYSGDLVEQTSEIFKLNNIILVNGIPSFTPNTQPIYNWEVSFFKSKVIWFYLGQ